MGKASSSEIPGFVCLPGKQHRGGRARWPGGRTSTARRVPGPPTPASADAPRVFTAHTTALLRRRFRSLSSVTAAIYTRVHGVTWRRRSRMTMWTILITVLLFASRTGCEQRTPERPPSFQAVLQCAQSVGRRESCQAGGSRQLPSDKPCGSQSPWTRPTGLGWKARTLPRPLGDHTQSQNNRRCGPLHAHAAAP